MRRRGHQSDLSNPIHDADGNMEQDANYDYTYDAEPERSGDRLPSFLNHRSQNRLIQRTPRNPSGNKMRLNFAYDYRGRRVEIISDYHTGSAWAVFYKETMLYDGWNPVMHYSYNDLYHGQTWVNRAYTWGLDLSGSLQGAGGVGGLLSVTGWLVRGSTSAASLRYYYTFDGNGNVSEVINYNYFSAYSMCAHHEYDAFGNLTRIDSGNGGWSIAATNPFRFSTKWHDLINSQEEWGTLPLVHSLDPSKLYYYGYRFYAPEHGRWINRDPIGERGGINLYGFVVNSAVNLIDLHGHSFWDWIGGRFVAGAKVVGSSAQLISASTIGCYAGLTENWKLLDDAEAEANDAKKQLTGNAEDLALEIIIPGGSKGKKAANATQEALAESAKAIEKAASLPAAKCFKKTIVEEAKATKKN